MNAIETRQEDFIRRLRILPGAPERLAALIEWGRSLPPPRGDDRLDENLVPGCV